VANNMSAVRAASGDVPPQKVVRDD
jgi:hypothetical protein